YTNLFPRRQPKTDGKSAALGKCTKSEHPIEKMVISGTFAARHAIIYLNAKNWRDSIEGRPFMSAGNAGI
ncbi:MAG: hypothetical protein PUD50_02665, partial [Eubacteriales bacterium]|nr:hypothetical protein [Eubacteriales bacterium]